MNYNHLFIIIIVTEVVYHAVDVNLSNITENFLCRLNVGRILTTATFNKIRFRCFFKKWQPGHKYLNNERTFSKNKIFPHKKKPGGFCKNSLLIFACIIWTL
jgi:hypothetical protein